MTAGSGSGFRRRRNAVAGRTSVLSAMLAALLLACCGAAATAAPTLTAEQQRIVAAIAASGQEVAPAPPQPPLPAPRIDAGTLRQADPATALGIARAAFPAVIADEPVNAIAGRAVRAFLNDKTARIEQGGERRLVVSTTPLRTDDASGATRLVDYELEADGAWRRPRLTPWTVALAANEPGATTIGPTAETAASIRLLGAADGAGTEIPGGLFFAEALPDTDVITKVTDRGTQTLAQIRSADAPRALAFAVTLPVGAKGRITPDGGFEASIGGRVAIHVAAPAAFDADGGEVPSSYSWDGATLTVAVEHRAEDHRYPVLLDPDWSSAYDWPAGDGFEGWGATRYPVDDDTWYHAFGTTAPGSAGHPEASGLWLVPRGGKGYVYDGSLPGEKAPRAVAFYIAPGNAEIRDVRFGGFRYSHYRDARSGRGDGQVARLAIYRQNVGEALVWGQDYSGEADEVFDDTIETGPLPPGARIVTFWLFTAPCATGTLCTWQVPRSDLASWSQVGSVTMTLTDPDPPSVALRGPLVDRGARWLNATDGLLAYTAAATDVTSGLRRVGAQSWLRGQADFNDMPGFAQPACDERHRTPGRQSAICQQSVENDTFFDPRPLPAAFAGWAQFRANAEDWAGNSAEGTPSTVWIDRREPTVALSGDLWELRSQWLRDPAGHAVRVRGRDDALAGESGVAAHELTIETQRDAGEPVVQQPAIAYDACPAPAAPVAPPADWAPCPAGGPTQVQPLDQLPEGRTRFSTTVTDAAGNRGSEAGGGSEAFEVFLDATRPALALAGSLGELSGSWTSPDGPLELAVTATDALSGLNSVVVELLDRPRGPARTLGSQQTCPAPAAGFSPCPRAAGTYRVGVAGTDIPEGDPLVRVRARDHAGNERERTIELHVDRTPPSVELTGPITRLADGLQAPDGPFRAVVRARDDRSGVRAVELWVRDAEGSERLLGRQQTCDETAAYSGEEAPCPLDVWATFDVDPSTLPNGTSTYFARAIEFTGLRARDGLDVELDNTEPAPPTDLRLGGPVTDSATISFTPGPEPDGGAGIDHYVITVVVDGVRTVENVSPHPYATIGGIPPGIDVRFLVRAVDRFGRESDPSTATGTRRTFTVPEPQAQASIAGFGSCTPTFDDTPAIRHPADPEAFVEERTRIEGTFWVVCEGLTKVDKVTITLDYAYGVGGRDYKVIGETTKRSFTKHALSSNLLYPGMGTFRYSHAVWCEPGAGKEDGSTRNWIVAGKIHYDRPKGYRDVTHEFYNDLAHPRQVWCPNRTLRMARRITAWNELARHVHRNYGAGRGAPSTQLRVALGQQPWAPPGVDKPWAAHHIVPHGARKALLARELLFRCRVHPNEGLNGVYLRASTLRRYTPAWYSLERRDPRLARRTYHPDTMADLYYARMNGYLSLALGGGEACTNRVRSETLYRMRLMRAALERGAFGAETGR